MDTWSIAKLALDAIFAVTLVSVVTVFLYRREKKIRSLIAQYVMNTAAEQSAPSSLREEYREPVYEPPVNVRPAATRTARPSLVAQYESQQAFTPPPPTARKASRAEKYLEAVRMYRQGSRREDIERNLGISFMELELLGQLK